MVKWNSRVPGVRSGPRFNSVDRIECVCVDKYAPYSVDTGQATAWGVGRVLFKQINLSLMRLSAASTIVAMGFALITCMGWRCVFTKGGNYYYYIQYIHIHAHNVSGVWKVIVRPSQV